MSEINNRVEIQVHTHTVVYNFPHRFISQI